MPKIGCVPRRAVCREKEFGDLPYEKYGLCVRLCARKKRGLVVYLEETWAMCLAVCRKFDDFP